VGGGPAGLAAAIRLEQRLAAAATKLSVVVVDKSPRPGYHCMSGAAFESACLDELLPGWRDEHRFAASVVPVERDEIYFLTRRAAVRIPDLAVPAAMRHRGDVAISLSRLVAFLAEHAQRLGVELHHGYAARELIVEDGAIRGVTLAELGLDRKGEAKPNHRPAEEVRARVTILADGSRGVLSSRFRERFGSGENPQAHSLGIKAVVQFPGENPFGTHRVIHTLGYPHRADVFGGGFIYSMGERTAALGLILGLDWRYGDLSPQREFETWRAHPFIERLLHGGVMIATGAKTIPEGGYYSLGRLSAPGAIVVGDGAGFINLEKLKGVHCAILSGMSAADTLVEALAGGDEDPIAEEALAGYRRRLEDRGVLPALRHARNYRQSFRAGLYLGTPLSLVQSWLPWRLGLDEDRAGTRPGARLERPDPGRMDGATFVSLTGSVHREDEPAHMTILAPAPCRECEGRFASACTHFCPGQVYRWNGEAIVLSPSNCLHCMTCAVKCPYANIRWLPPEGGEGPRFKHM
jgi:electron-transferring-flavoprotein dehydrogenase